MAGSRNGHNITIAAIERAGYEVLVVATYQIPSLVAVRYIITNLDLDGRPIAALAKVAGIAIAQTVLFEDKSFILLGSFNNHYGRRPAANYAEIVIFLL